MAVIRTLFLLTPFFGGVAMLSPRSAKFAGSAAHKGGAAPNIAQVVSAASEQLKVLNTTVDTAITLLTTANTTGCGLLSTASSGLDALAPLLAQMDNAAKAIASLPFSSASADEAKAKVSSFVESVTAQIEASDSSLDGGCGKFSAALMPLIEKLTGTLDSVFAQYSAALDQVSLLAPEASFLLAKSKLWPFTSSKPANKFAKAESAVKAANASVAGIDVQLAGFNSTIVDAMVTDVMDVTSAALTQFQDSCLQGISGLPSTLSGQASELCTKSTDAEEAISAGLGKFVNTIPTAVEKARASLSNVYTVADNLLTAINEAQSAEAEAAAASDE